MAQRWRDLSTETGKTNFFATIVSRLLSSEYIKIIHLSCGERNEEMIDRRSHTQHDQLPDGLIVQLAAHCTVIAEVMGSNPVQV